MEKTRKIAIINTVNGWSSYDDCSVIVNSISDWSEVSEEDYQTLVRFSRNYDWDVIQRLDSDENFIPLTISRTLAEAKAQKEQEEKRKQAEAAKKAQRELKKRAKTEEQERKLLEELQSKYKGK